MRLIRDYFVSVWVFRFRGACLPAVSWQRSALIDLVVYTPTGAWEYHNTTIFSVPVPSIPVLHASILEVCFFPFSCAVHALVLVDIPQISDAYVQLSSNF